MFYSKDLLSRKSPLGAIWTVAHGKKLSKSKLLGISVQEICNQILNPEVPHSLRLQGILVGGVVVVYNKQQAYLLEDIQEMVRRVKSAIDMDTHGGKATLKRGSDKARHEAVTLDGGVAVGLDGTDLNNLALDGEGVLLTQRLGSLPSDVMLGEEESELFALPALSSRADSGLLSMRADGQDMPGRLHHASKGRRAALGLAGAGAAPRGGGGSVHDALAEGDEVFGVEGDLDGLMGLEEGLMGLDQNNAAYGDPAEFEGEGDKAGPAEALSPRSAERRAAAVESMREEFAASDAALLAEEEGGGGRKRRAGAAGAQGPQKPAPGKRARVATDALEEIQIKQKVFRDWTLDASPLVAARGLKRGALGQPAGAEQACELPAPAAAAAAAFSSGLRDVFWGEVGLQHAGGGGGQPEAPLCGEMRDVLAQALFGPPSAPAGAAPPAKRMRKGAAAGASEGQEGHAGHAGQMDDHLAHDEFQDQLPDLPPFWEGGVEVERLRAGGSLTPGAGAAAAMDAAGLGGSAQQRLLAGARQPGGSATTTASHESLGALGMRPGAHPRASSLGAGSDLLLPGSGHHGPGARATPAMRWGEGALADLLASAGAGSGGGLEHLMDLRAGSEEAGSHGGRRRAGALRAGSSSEDPLGTAHQQLLEATDRTTQSLHLHVRDSISKNTALVVQAVRARLALQEAAGVADPAVSFLELAQQLCRGEAVKLFMQVLVTHSACFVTASQAEAYGDIMLRAGRFA